MLKIANVLSEAGKRGKVNTLTVIWKTIGGYTQSVDG